MADDGVGGWVKRMLCDNFDLACKAPVAAKNAVEVGVRAGAEAVVEGVTTNSGGSGQAARALGGREAQIEAAINNAVGGGPAIR